MSYGCLHIILIKPTNRGLTQLTSCRSSRLLILEQVEFVALKSSLKWEDVALTLQTLHLYLQTL